MRAQRGFVSFGVERINFALAFVRKDKEKQRPVVPQSQASHLLARATIADVDVLVPGLVAGHFERGDRVTKKLLEAILRPENKLPNDRVEAVRSDDQLKAARRRVLETDLHAVRRLSDFPYAVAKNGFAISFDISINVLCQVAAGNCHVSTMGGRPKNVHIEAAHASPACVNNPHFLDLVSITPDVREYSHAFGDVETKPPEINGVTTRAQARRTLHES